MTELIDPGYAIKQNISSKALWRDKKPRLDRLDIELTERCNNACIHCYINLTAKDTQAARRELTTDQWNNILRQAAALGVLTIRITGGEPLLRDDFSEIYLYARHLGIQVIIFTNARLITPELADLFARVPPRKKIEISVYGMHPWSYDEVTCTKGAFIEFRRGVELLEERKIPYVVKSVLLPPNRGEITEFENWAASIPWMDKYSTYATLFELRTRRDSPVKNRLIRNLRISPEECIALISRNARTYRNEMSQFSVKFLGPQGDRIFACGAGERGCVDAYGMYQMCILLRHPDTVYNLKRGTLFEGLTEMFPRLRELRTTNLIYLERCARCFLKGLCEQCPGRSWEENGTLDTPVEYLCQVAHAQARFLGLIGDYELGWEVADWRERVRRLAIQDDVDNLP